MARIENKYLLTLCHENGKYPVLLPLAYICSVKTRKTHVSITGPGFECQKQPALCHLIPKKDPERGHEQRAEAPLTVCLHFFCRQTWADSVWLQMTGSRWTAIAQNQAWESCQPQTHGFCLIDGQTMGWANPCLQEYLYGCICMVLV